MAKQKRSTRRKTLYEHTVLSWRSFPPILLISSILLNAPYVIPSHLFSAEAFSYKPTAEKLDNRCRFTRSPILLRPLKTPPAKADGVSRWYLAASTENNNAFNDEDSSPRYPSSRSLPLYPNLTARQVFSSSPLPRKPNRQRDNVGGYDPTERIGEGINVGDPQIKVEEKEFSVTSILRELAAIQQKGPQKYCILGTRHCSYLHQQIIELLAYALVLSGNHVYTSGAGGTHAATIRGALRAERPDLLTVVLPQSLAKQTKESQSLLKEVKDVVEMPQNNDMSLDIASRICNSKLLSLTDQLISFAFHESSTVIEATKEAKKLNMLVTVLYLD